MMERVHDDARQRVIADGLKRGLRQAQGAPAATDVRQLQVIVRIRLGVVPRGRAAVAVVDAATTDSAAACTPELLLLLWSDAWRSPHHEA
jgi:hypothetical protein